MATIKKFEDLEVWQKSRSLCKDIYEISNKGKFNIEYDLKNQILRSSGSVMDNIAEGFERGGRGEFIQFLGISKSSAGEVRSQLHRALDRNLITKKEFDSLYSCADEIGKMLRGFMEYLKTSEFKGVKYKSSSSEITNSKQ